MAFDRLAAQLRPGLRSFIYRMVTQPEDADDLVQETLLRAWRGLSGFDGRASLRTWLYRIATNVCLDAIADRKRRQRPVLCREVGCIDEDLTALPADHWIEPIPDLQAVPTDVDPAQQAALRQSIRLAFVAALQHLPPGVGPTLVRPFAFVRHRARRTGRRRRGRGAGVGVRHGSGLGRDGARG